MADAVVVGGMKWCDESGDEVAELCDDKLLLLLLIFIEGKFRVTVGCCG